jgi:aminomethyltransferase
LQGPEAPSLFEDMFGDVPKRFRTSHVKWGMGEVWMAGTGYTGERGGEICVDPETGRRLVERLVDAGVTACGLAARDTLRLETGLPLWGADMDETTTPLEAGLDFAVEMDHEFVGRAALQERSDPDRLLVGFVLEEKGIPRHGYRVRTPGGQGQVTSGNLSPMLDTGVGLAYVSPPPAPEASEIEVEIRNRWVAGRIAKPPFHKR